ncbi:MAG TPA: hypothetical protein VK887_15110 [Pseudonocardiaceae bacterium]|nr:hypothetical protein [Pseudonocardiaceae bacterium]
MTAPLSTEAAREIVAQSLRTVVPVADSFLGLKPEEFGARRVVRGESKELT